jgi:hypothetical protein
VRGDGHLLGQQNEQCLVALSTHVSPPAPLAIDYPRIASLHMAAGPPKRRMHPPRHNHDPELAPGCSSTDSETPLVQRGGGLALQRLTKPAMPNRDMERRLPKAYVKVRPVEVSLHTRFDLIFASRACASAMMRTTAVAMFARPRGSALVTLDAAGQVISTAGGLSAGRINSIRTVSPLGVIWPAANSMRDDVDTAGSFRSRPRRAVRTRTEAAYWT